MVILANECTALCLITLIADQKIEPSCPTAELMTENSVLSVEIKAVDKGQSSAAPVPNPEKWSHEAIVAPYRIIDLPISSVPLLS